MTRVCRYGSSAYRTKPGSFKIQIKYKIAKAINGLGRRKTAVDRVYLKSGKKRFIINGKEIKGIYRVKTAGRRGIEAFEHPGSASKFDITVNVKAAESKDGRKPSL
ncbi:MAG: 30S ribosomal protein S9 [Sphingobacteriales bacterium]|nr:30S ribosomal protein S9 [Sphingobacteriales bacterium]